jgi:hypothetical protein
MFQERFGASFEADRFGADRFEADRFEAAALCFEAACFEFGVVCFEASACFAFLDSGATFEVSLALALRFACRSIDPLSLSFSEPKGRTYGSVSAVSRPS